METAYSQTKAMSTDDEKSFWKLFPYDSGEDGLRVAEEFIRHVTNLVIDTPRNVAPWLNETAQHAPSEVETFLLNILARIIPRCKALTCVIESNHVDAVYRDLYVQSYASEFFESSRFTVRVSFFDAELDEDSYFLRPGYAEWWEREILPIRTDASGKQYRALQEDFIGSVVFIPRESGIVGRTLLDPRWIVDGPCELRLSDFQLTVRGKRLHVQAFPYRHQDEEVLSCAELSVLNMVCYYSNEFNEYSVTMPGQVLSEVARSASVRVIPSNGLRYDDVGRVLRKVGFFPRRYDIRYPPVQDNDDGTTEDAAYNALARVLRAYVDSGIPIAVNNQRRDIIAPGHSLIVIGLGPENATLPSGDIGAKTVASEIDGVKKSVRYVGVADLERGREYVLIDDRQLPYVTAAWPHLSEMRELEVVELMVPLTRTMELDAVDARKRADIILENPTCGLVSALGEVATEGETFVITQQMVSIRSYLRYRVATCDPSLAFIYEGSSFPTYSWLFEIVPLSEWNKPRQQRMAVGELLLDATATSNEPMRTIVLMRFPKLLYYRGPDGDTFATRVGAYPAEFHVYMRNLRPIKPHTQNSGDDS